MPRLYTVKSYESSFQNGGDTINLASMQESYSVKDFGAVGDGVTNDTAAITDAFTALGAATHANGNARLVFPPGTYMVDGIVASGLTNFQLSGPGCLKLNLSRSGNALVNTNDVLSLVNCTDFLIDGLEVNGNRHTDVSWPTTDRAPVTQYLQSNAASGQAVVAVSDGTKFQVGERVWVCGGLTANGTTEKGFVDNNSQQGLAIDAINGNSLTLHSNLVNAYTATGASGGAYVTTYQTGYQNAVGTYTLGNEDQQNGIHLLACTRFTISRCYCHDTWESGIKLGIGFDSNAHIVTASCTHGLITNNRILRGYDQGVSIWYSQFIRVIGNHCDDAGWGGCVMSGSDDCAIIGNTFRNNYYRVPGDNNEGMGCVVEGGSRNNISNNLITANFMAGVLLRTSPLSFGISSPTLNGNLAWGSTAIPMSSGTGFVVGAKYMIIDGANSESFIVASVSVNTVTATEKTRYYHASGKTVSSMCGEDNVVEGNTITESVNQHGVWVSPSVRSNIRNNIIMRNALKGILVEKSGSYTSDGTTIDGNYISGNGMLSSSQGILVDACIQMQIINNTINGNFGDRCIQMKGTSDSRVANNTVMNGQSDGIEFETSGIDCARVVVANNTVRQCNGVGIYTQRGNHFTIIGNECWSNASSGGMRLGGLTHSTIKGNICIANNTNGIVLEDNNAIASTYNLIEGNVARDDGSGIKASDGTSLTQGVSITLTGSENNNTILNNQVDHATAKVGGSTTITGDIVN